MESFDIQPDVDTQADAPPAHPLEFLMRSIQSINMAVDMTDSELGAIGMDVVREYEIDDESRADWLKEHEQAFKLAMQVAQEKTYPWPKASNVIFPLMTTAALQFNARAYPAVIAGRNVVKGVVVGDDKGIPAIDQATGQIIEGQWVVPPGAKQIKADAIGEHMSWQLLDEMPEWEPETDKLLLILPIAGTVFRKTYFDKGMGRNCSNLVLAENLVINYSARSVENAPRLTEILRYYPHEIVEFQRAGVWVEHDFGMAQDSGNDPDAQHIFLEQHRRLDLDDDGYSEPYIVTVHKDTSKVCRIVACYDADSIMVGADGNILKINRVEYYTKYGFIPSPDGGIYDVGFGKLLNPINKSVNTTLNMLLDAGHLANTGGGFIGKGLAMSSGAVRFAPGEYKVVKSSSDDIRSAIVPLQFPGPSPVLFNLLGLLIDAGKDVAAVKDVLTGEQQQSNIPATTTLALIEQGLKVFTAIYKRVHLALKSELNKLYKLNQEYLNEESGYRIGDEWKTITRALYESGAGVEPMSDPTMVSDMQRLGRAQFLMQFADDPNFDGREIRRRMLEAAQVTGIDKLMVDQPPPNPELAIKGMEMDMQAKKNNATELREMAQALLYFAQADQAIGAMNLQWAQHQMEVFKAQFEDAQSGNKPDQQGGLGGVETSPDNQDLSAVSGGQGGIPQSAGF